MNLIARVNKQFSMTTKMKFDPNMTQIGLADIQIQNKYEWNGNNKMDEPNDNRK